eukprot:SAG25_NODE_1228_length_3560_cov_1.934142_3_plen_115_part_00
MGPVRYGAVPGQQGADEKGGGAVLGCRKFWFSRQTPNAAVTAVGCLEPEPQSSLPFDQMVESLFDSEDESGEASLSQQLAEMQLPTAHDADERLSISSDSSNNKPKSHISLDII